MNDLPDEILTNIFEHLKFKDLIQCSSVCKRFKFLCEDVKITELIISNTTENEKDFWFYTNKQFNLQDAITVTTFNSYRSIFRLDKLRRLYFDGSHWEYAQLRVNDLTKVEQLKINVAAGAGVKYDIYIDLPNLKIVDVDVDVDVDAWNQKFFITTPKLEMVKCTNFDVIHLTNPSTIKHVETDSLSDRLHKLKNLEFLLVTFFEEINLANFLSSFPKLTTFSCTGHCDWVPSEIRSLIEYKRACQVSQPTIYFLSVEMNDITDIDGFLKFRDVFPFQINNYGSLAETVPMRYIMSYSQVMDSMKGRVPDDFFTKYFDVRFIRVEKPVANQEHLFGFLRNFDYLTEVWLQSDSLDQSYLNRLHELDQLISLTVGEFKSSYDSIEKTTLNFDVLLKMQRLRIFYGIIDSVQFLDLALKLFAQLKYFESIEFFYERSRVSIRKNFPSNDYEVSYSRHVKLDFNGLVELVDAIKLQGVTPTQ